jgi:cytoplasmic iron level regulating protein YaaA (DUF328/UPF0246 family)
MSLLLLLSPAKIQNFEKQNICTTFSLPHFMNEAQELVQLMQQLPASELSKLLDINAQLTQLNTDRYLNWHLPFTPENAKQAVLTFDGEVFRGLDASNFNDADFAFAQQSLLILSGLYGALRPLDLIQPYRLEVSSKLKNANGNTLYHFWKSHLTDFVERHLRENQTNSIVNLASSEYFKAIDAKKLNVGIVDVEFYQYKNDDYKQIVIYTKKARGLMASYIIKNKLENPDDLKGFDAEGYWFSPQMSTDKKFVFVR